MSSVNVFAGNTGIPDTSWYIGNEDAASYTIYTADQLAGLAELINADILTSFWNKTVSLGADIDLSSYGKNYNDGRGWIPIRRFFGEFDGNNKTISGLYINAPDMSRMGLFINANFGSVKNLRLVDVDITGNNYAGGIAAESGSLIENCSVTGIVRGRDFVGGLVGSLGESIIKNSYTDATVIGNSTIGGLVGTIDILGSIESSFSAGSVSGNNNVGGIAGIVDISGSIINSYSAANVSGNNFVGGIAGFLRGITMYPVPGYGRAQFCYATGTISGNNSVAGIVGGAATNMPIPATQCVALNPKVEGVTNVNRVRAGSYISNPNNRYTARNDMIVLENGEIALLDKGFGRPDGEDITMQQALSSDFWIETMEFDTDIWDIADGRLPILKNVTIYDGFDVPSTGVRDMTSAIVVMFIFLVMSAVLWRYVGCYKKKLHTNV